MSDGDMQKARYRSTSRLMAAAHAAVVAACLVVPLVACAGDDDGLVGLASHGTPAPTPDMEGQVPFDDEQTSSVQPTPPPTPIPLPSGFDNSGSRPGMLSVMSPGAIGIGRSGDLYVASAPHTLLVLSEFGTVKATASLALLPERFAFLGNAIYYGSGNALVTLNASNSVTEARNFTVGSPSFVAVTTFGQQGQTQYRAVAAGSKVTIHRDATADERDFPNGVVPVSIALDFRGNLWGVGGGTLAKLKQDPSDDPIVVGVSDLGTLKGVAIENAIGDDSFWVLGTTGLARYNSAGDRLGTRIAFAGGDRLFVKGARPIVVKDAAGEIVRFKPDGAPEPTVKLEGGVAGAAMDAQGNLWVSSLAEGKILHTRLDP
jgi:hypothetical protein